MITRPTIGALKAIRQQRHPECLVCARRDSHLYLDFRLADDDSVEATFECNAALQGYPDRLHGGVICTWIDGAMANCLFAHGLAGVTAELKVRFRHPVSLGKPARVRAWIGERMAPLFRLRAEVIQDDRVVASAEGKFVDTAAIARLSLPTQTS